MKILAALLLAGLAGAVQAAGDTAHDKELIEQHRAIAKAHAEAAQCLASGQPEQDCHRELNKACKKLPVIGALCGMRKHRH